MEQLMKINGKNIRLFLMMILILGCATQSRKFGNLPNLSIDQIVHRDILQAVGVNLPKEPDIFVDAQLSHYVTEFIEDAKTRGRDVSSNSVGRLRVIKFVDKLSQASGPNVVASCNSYFLKKPTVSGGGKPVRWKEIEVHRDGAEAFRGGEELRFKMLIYHELFHCLFNRGHLPEFDANGKMVYGIMSEVLKKNTELTWASWQKLLDDMFINHFDITPML